MRRAARIEQVHVTDALARADVARETSSFVDVVTTALRASSTLGTSSELVFPDRVGPSTSVLRRCPLNTLVVPVRPR